MFEAKKLMVERAKVEAAKMEFELKIMSAEMDIERLRKNISVQEKRIEEINQELKKIQGA